MSILIKGAKMPASCEECQSVLGLFGSKECPLFKDFPKKFISESELLKHTRYSDCPLVKISSHGRLIDADKFMKPFWDLLEENEHSLDYYSVGYGGLSSMIDDAPTVIESEEQEHE